MNREALIQYSVKSLRRLPKKRVNEVVDFIDFISDKYKDELLLQKNIHKMVEQSDSFSFLEDEEDLYTIEDLKEKY